MAYAPGGAKGLNINKQTEKNMKVDIITLEELSCNSCYGRGIWH